MGFLGLGQGLGTMLYSHVWVSGLVFHRFRV